MLTEEESVEISVLRKQGYSLRQICRMTGCSLNTVRKYQSGTKPNYPARTVLKPQKLDPYKSYIRERLDAVNPHWIPATVIFREIKAKGYTGQIRQLRYFMAELKPQAKVESVTRFETAPGEQLQVDWAHFSYRGVKLYAFVAILGYSRMAYVQFTNDMTIDTLLTCHQHAFDVWGGVTSHVLYDNMKTVVVARNAYGAGQHRLHPKLYDFAKHYGFLPCLCRPYRAKTKGKVERFIRYLRASFFTPLVGRLKMARLPLDAQTANLEVRYWLDEVANVRDHASLKARPSERFRLEAKGLRPLPRQPYLPIPFAPAPVPTVAWPVEHLQHALHVYEQLFKEDRA